MFAAKHLDATQSQLSLTDKWQIFSVFELSKKSFQEVINRNRSVLEF